MNFIRPNNEGRFGGGILTGLEIHNQVVKEQGIIIEPYCMAQLNPNSYNLRLANKLKCYRNHVLDSHTANAVTWIDIPEEGIVLYPGELYLGSTVERTATNKFIPSIEGRSSVGRLGINIHVCAGFGDIGFDGHWTLEIVVTKPVRIYAGDEIAQISFSTYYGDPAYKYHGRYYGQEEALESKFINPKTKESLAYGAIDYSNMKRIVKQLYAQYGEYEFSSHGYSEYTSDFSLELYKGETLKGHIICDASGNDIGETYTVTLDGKLYTVYVRRTGYKGYNNFEGEWE